MKKLVGGALASLLLSTVAMAQGAPQPFAAGLPLGVTANGQYTAMSKNVKVYGAVVNTESCSYDEGRGLILGPARGAPNNRVQNDGFVALFNHDGSVHTPLWIGQTRNGLVLNDPTGSDIANGKFYVADRDGGAADGAPTTAVIRIFDLKTGAPAGELKVADSPSINDIEVAEDGTVYASQTGGPGVAQRIYKITASGQVSVFIEGAPLALPNGVAFDNDGNIVVINIDSAAVLTFDKAGKLLKTEQASMPGNDGLVIMKDGTKYVSSVRNGGVSRIRPGRPSELIATGIPSPASMCYDSGANQLVIPMNTNNGLAFIKLGN
jgi:hypothetical protein